MAISSPPSATTTTGFGMGGRRPLGLWANVKKRKHNFVQLVVMSGIFLLSLRSLGQKYRIHDLTEDNYALKEEQGVLIDRMRGIKQSLLDEAAREPTGAFAARLRLLFGDESN